MTAVLFVGGFSRGQVSKRRAELLMQRGVDVRVFDTDKPMAEAGLFSRQLTLRAQFGPLITKINRELIAAARSLPRGSAVFFDKPVWIQSGAIEAMRAAGLRTICYTPDDPFGPRRDGVWRLFEKALPLYDVHIVPREVSVAEFHRHGAKRVLLRRFSYDPRFHMPGEPSRGHFPLGYSYIGSPHEHRPAFLLALREKLAAAGARLSVFGPNWMHWRHRETGTRLEAGPPLWEGDYRDAIWNSLACLAFVTRLNRDEISHKAIEIAACGRAPVLEPDPVHAELFSDGESAIFFRDVEECADKLIFYADRPEDLTRIGLAASESVRRAGYSEDSFIDLVIEEIRG